MRPEWVGCVAMMAGLWTGAAWADRPPTDAHQPPTREAAREQGQPDDSFLEFLGRDDVEDAKWWEFFRQHRGHPRDAAADQAPGEDERS